MEEKSFTILLAVGMGIMLSLLCVFFLYMLYTFKNRKNKELIDNSIAGSIRLFKDMEENERVLFRLSRDVHDLFAQVSLLIKHHIGVVEHMEKDSPEYDESMNALKDLNDQLFADANNLCQSLNKEYIAATNFCDLLKEELNYVCGNTDIDYQLYFPDHVSLKYEYRVIVYRIVKEALHNVVRHALATKVNVEIDTIEDQLKITIKDNGIGFTKDRIYASPISGIAIMRERAAMVNGNLDIESNLLEGCTVTLTMPTRASNEQPSVKR